MHYKVVTGGDKVATEGEKNENLRRTKNSNGRNWTTVRRQMDNSGPGQIN